MFQTISSSDSEGMCRNTKGAERTEIGGSGRPVDHDNWCICQRHVPGILRSCHLQCMCYYPKVETAVLGASAAVSIMLEERWCFSELCVQNL